MLLKKNIPLKYIFGKIKYEMIGVSLYTIIITILYHVRDFSQYTVPLAVPTIMITVVSLLLAFRSNQAYDRWWEARTIWGAIVNDSRTIARQISNFIQEGYPGDELFFFKSSFIKRQIAWCVSLNNSLRGRDGIKGIEKYVSRNELTQLRNFSNVPMGILHLHAQDLQKAYQNGWINAYQHVEIDQTLTRFSNSMGACERIKKTVFPATYSLYIHFSLLFFFIMLPFSLFEDFGWMTIPMVSAVAAMFFLIEKMAVHLQDPFENKPTDTPMTSICLTIERDLKQMINDPLHNEAGVAQHHYYVM